MPDDLLRTKLFIPPVRPGQVARPRLLQRLEDGLQEGQRLTLVSAPPGFGKTTAITEWIAEHRNPQSAADLSTRRQARFCWLALDEADSDPVHFWRYLLTALQTVEPQSGESELNALRSPQPPSLKALASSLINNLSTLSSPLVLVLDDYHLIENKEIHESLNFFLDHLPPQAHLVIATRSDPPLQLARRRGRGELNEIRAADLRFTPQETLAFFNESMKLGLSTGDISALEVRTEGWIVGMQMAALSLQGISDKHSLVEAFSGDDRFIADYLVEEVLNRQTEPIQEFLLKTSVLERLSASLCDAVLSGETSQPAVSSQQLLDYLERSNLFLIPLDHHRQWFRYHHLFANLLRQKLEQTAGSETLLLLQHRACLWYEQNGLIPEAIRLALACADYANAGRMLEGYADQMFIFSELTSLFTWACLLSDAILSTHPRLVMAAAWAAHATGHSVEARKFLTLLETMMGATVNAYIIATDRLAELLPIPRAALIEASMLYMRMALDQQNSVEANLLGERVLPYLVRERDSEPFIFNPPSNLRSASLFQLALAAKQQDNLEEARLGFEEATALASVPPINIHIIATALGHLAEVLILQQEYERAEEVCQQALGVLQGYSSIPTAFFGMTYVNLARLAFIHGDDVQAAEHLKKGLELCQLWNFWEGLIPGYRLLAEMRLSGGDTPGAQAALQELSVLGAGNAVVNLAVEAAHRELLEKITAHSGTFPSGVKRPFRKQSNLLVEQLSEREMEVLYLIAQGATNTEIAQKLVLSINTVKKHVTNIFAKLGATTRLQAVDKARKARLVQ